MGEPHRHAGPLHGQNGAVSRPDPEAPVMVAQNRRARHEYLILEEIEAGLVLKGTEVKSLRAGRCSLAESHVRARSGELFLVGAHIPEYSHGGPNNHEPTRERKLLAHRREIDRLDRGSREKGVTLIPLDLYFRAGRAKLRVGLARGKKLHDKRDTERARDDRREIDRAMKSRRRED
jgi:SsrA-binding protein